MPLQILFLKIFCSCIVLCGILAQSEDVCNHPLTAGLRDDQFWASSEYNVKYNASAARSSGEGWNAASGGASEYLKVDLDTLWELTAMDVQGSSLGHFSRTFRISHSMDGYVWTGYNTRLSDVSLGELFTRQGTTTVLSFDPSIKARYIVINPVSTLGHAALRIELYGCQSIESPSSLPTGIQGNIEADTTWIPSQSPILVDRPVIVKASAMLTVMAGVSVIFTNEAASLTVYGTLSIEGLKGLPALFSSDHPVLSARSKWLGIRQGAEGHLNVTFAVVRQAETGFQGYGTRTKIANSELYSCVHGSQLSGGNIYNISTNDMVHIDDMIFVGTNIHDNRYGIILHGTSSNSHIPIGYSHFDQNVDAGIAVRNWNALNQADIVTNLYIVNCSMDNNTNYGLLADQSILTNTYILNSRFIGNLQKGIRYYKWRGGSETLFILNSFFVENKATGLEFYCYTCEPNTHMYQNNTFRGQGSRGMDISVSFKEENTSNIMIQYNSFYQNLRDIRLHIQNNGRAFIQNNRFEQSRAPIELTGGGGITAVAVLFNNSFTAHTSTYDESVIEIDRVITSITNSTFSNSSISTLIRYNSGLDHEFAYNRFVNTSRTSCFLTLRQGYESDASMNIDYNYWDTPDKNKIKTKICDFFVDSSKAVAKLNEFYPTIMMETPTSAAGIDDFRFDISSGNALVVGGIIRDNIDNDFSNVYDRLIVNRSVLILESANVNIGGVNIQFATNRGIVVHGTLSIVKGENASVATILQHQDSGRWNGISSYSKRISITNSYVYGTQRFVTMHGTNTNIVVNNCSVTDDTLQYLIYANSLNGNHSIFIEKTTVKTRSTAVYIYLNDTKNLNINFTKSEFSSGGYVIQLRESSRHSDLRNVHMDITKCNLVSSGSKVLYLQSCSSHLEATITESNFSSVYYYDTNYFQYPSMNILISETNFGDAATTLYFTFCDKVSPSNYSNVINITNNTFNSSSRGQDIILSKGRTNEHSHAIYITNNTFGFDSTTSRRRVYVDGYIYYDCLHTIEIRSNRFVNSKDTVIDLRRGCKEILISGNLFENNMQCIYLSSREKLNRFEIWSNTFNNNTLTNGVIYIEQIISNITSIMHNTFVNNTNVAIIFQTLDIFLRYNIFENGKDTYNLKVLTSNTHSGKIVNASLNYWGTTDVKTIAKSIYDKDYDDKLPDIVFRPYLGSRNITDIQDKNASFVTKDGEVGGPVNGNITLTKDKSPYLVVSNIEVGHRDILTVESGAVLLAKPGVGIKVFGQIKVLGTADQPVEILPEIAGEPWRGLELLNATDVLLRYLVLNGTQQGMKVEGSNLNIHNLTSTFSLQSGLTLTTYDDKNQGKQSSVKLSEINVKSSGLDGILLTGKSTNETSIIIDGCSVLSNERNGVRIETDSVIILNNCIIQNNTFSAISINQAELGQLHINSSLLSNNTKHAIEGVIGKTLSISFCNVSNHSYGYYSYYGYWSTNSYIDLKFSHDIETLVEITNSNFRDNVADGILISNSYYGSGSINVHMEKCVFSGGNRTLVVRDTSAWWIRTRMNITFLHNIIEHNVWNSRGNSDLRLVTFVLDAPYDIQIKNNIFRNNTAESGFYVTRTAKPGTGNGTLIENKFLENNFSVSAVDIASHINIEVHRNIFTTQHDHSCVITAPKFDVNFAINATHNYWGTADARSVVRKVCGYDKSMDKSFIWFIPFYQANDLNEVVSSDPSKLNLSDTFGGEITNDIIISKNEYFTPIRVDRSIMIREGAVLKIEEGVVFHFESDRGIYVQGSLQVLGRDGTIELGKTASASSWYGVMINSSAQAGQLKTVIDNTIIHQTMYGVVLYSGNAEIKGSKIINSTSHCLTLYQSKDHQIHDFEKSSFEYCSDNGISLVGDGKSTLMQAEIKMSKTGIGLQARSGSVDIRSINVSDVTQAMSVVYSDISEAGNITIENCILKQCSKGLNLQSENVYGHNSIKVSRSKFTNVATDSLNVMFPSYYYYVSNTNTNRTVDISLNTFRNSCGVVLNTWNNVNVTVHDNLFLDADCSHDSDCILYAYANGNAPYKRRRNFDISTNLFQNLSGECVFLLKDNNVSDLHGAFVYNQMIGNLAHKGVVAYDATYFNVSQNIFDNPDSSFDVYAYTKGAETVNVTKNWWGSSDINQVYNRIFDQRQQPELILFEVNPVLTDRNVDCSAVNNCSSRGDCVSPNRCRCRSGWTGRSCEDYDCAGVGNCYGNGQCVGPNICKCHEGWSGTLCIEASCINVNNCSGHGVCVRPDVCTCAAKFTGNDCSSCVPLHWGEQCRPCPDCKHGTCNLQHGSCDCEGKNWSGYLCDKCADTYYGVDCLPLIKVLEILPKEGSDRGGNSVHVWGHNFPRPSNGTYYCRFGNTDTTGTWLAWNRVQCIAPRHAEGMVNLEISPDGQEYTNDRLKYFFYATCPLGSCGGDFSPSRGQCLFGGCSCFLPWTGDNCDKELFAPKIIEHAAEQYIKETESYSVTLKLQEGDSPITWTLLTGPKGMRIDERTGVVSWSHAYASSVPYAIKVQAKNIIGVDTITWKLIVPISYTVTVDGTDASIILPVPRPVQIYGTVTFSNDLSPRLVPLDVIVTSERNGRETLIQELSDALAPTTFRTTYFPRPDDAGIFYVSARHPGEKISMKTNVTWSVLGMRCEPSVVNVNQKILSDDGTVTVYTISSLTNVGNGTIQNITAEVEGLQGTFVRKSGETENSHFFLPELLAGGKIEFDLVVTNAKPLFGTIYAVFTSDERTVATMKINIKLSVQRPNLVFDPPSITENIVRGRIRVFDIMINNTGEVAARAVDISLPNDPRVSLVSFTTFGMESNLTSERTIPSGGAALMSIAVTADSTAALGEMWGKIYVNSELSSNSFAYKLYVTSKEKFNVTFEVKDEYTYFAAGSPLVSNAKVTLVNPRRGYSETRYTTNETGTVDFEDVYEDQYTLYAEAESHSSYGAVILITSDTTMQDIFLQRVAVKYTWTVEPTTVEDVYNIQLESTFETYVPMPVVTIVPAKVNTVPLEMEEYDTIEFNITNHGLIRADNVRFTLPTGHPYLTFELTVDFIGSVDANTSIIVPVKATLKNRVKRNVPAMTVCGLAVLYDYICGGTKTRSLDVTLTREYPGRPLLPCSGVGGGGRSGGERGGGVIGVRSGEGIGSGSAVTYNPTTPLSCDCAKTLIKGCALSFLPIVGCGIAINDVATSLNRSDGDAVVGTLNVVVGLADTAFACVFGVICNVCGLLYTSIRCLVDVAINCNGGRERRDVSSEVVNNILATAGPIGNFLQMMTEILGDEGMYNLEPVWYSAFKKTIGEDSELGTRLSNAEAIVVIDSLTDQAAKANLSRFLDRWNNTAAAWENGTLTDLESTNRVISLTRLTPRIEQYLIDVESAAARGFDTIFDEFDSGTNAYKVAEQQGTSGSSQKDDGVCARVRVRISQELVFTRDAFNARLEIENGEKSDLVSIKVEIHIKRTFGQGELANDMFSVGEPTLIGISGVEGTGTLGRDLSGTAEWLIIPYSNAAPEDDVLYDIGGRLSYSVGGSHFSVPLLPDTVTVKANPSLVVHYFHEKYIQGDNALTPEIEPSVPFSLAVMVMNNGYGIARALKITSGQPEIIENEKGLLISFKIIGAQLGNQSITPSLSVNFGDISSFETKTARWLLTSTLMGTFYNYSATFENINPLGDPQLSLMDVLEYHELIHLVRIGQRGKDDGLDDFLVNDFVDGLGMPDRLYNSANASDVRDVHTVNSTNMEVATFGEVKKYISVKLSVKTNTSQWFYIRKENTFSSPDSADNEHLLYAEAPGGRTLLLGKNVWQTTHIFDTFYLHILDILDNKPDAVTSSEEDVQYHLIFGPRNMFAPMFNASTYSATVSKSIIVGAEVARLYAYDIDKDRIEFSIQTINVTHFHISAISETSAAIFVSTSPLENGQVSLIVMAEDSGIPPRSTYINVTIQVTDSNETETTRSTTDSYVTTSPSSVTTATATTNATVRTSTTGTSSTDFKASSVSGTKHTSPKATIISTSTTHASTKNETVSFTTDSSTENTFSATPRGTSSYSEKSPTKSVNTATQKNISESTTPPARTTHRFATTTPTSGTKDKQEGSEAPFWVIPMSLGVAVLVISVIVVVYVLRKKS